MDYIKQFNDTARSFNRYSEKTLDNYNVTYRQFQEYLDKDLIDVNRMDLESFINYLREKNGGKLSNSTINTKLSALDTLYQYLFKNDIIENNPVKKIERAKIEDKQLTVLDKTDIDKMINNCDNKRDKAIIAFMFTTGCRISEVVNADKTDIYQLPPSVDAEGMRFHVRSGKGSKDRMVFIPMNYFRYIHNYLEEREDDIPALFISNRQQRIHKDTISYTLNKSKKKSDIRRPITPHTLRRTSATYLINNDVDILAVSKQLGHSDVSTTDRGYVKYADKKRAENTLSAWSGD
ncbi:MAG: tyrosine-type recombinase/integrase [bacterium]